MLRPFHSEDRSLSPEHQNLSPLATKRLYGQLRPKHRKIYETLDQASGAVRLLLKQSQISMPYMPHKCKLLHRTFTIRATRIQHDHDHYHYHYHQGDTQFDHPPAYRQGGNGRLLFRLDCADGPTGGLAWDKAGVVYEPYVWY